MPLLMPAGYAASQPGAPSAENLVYTLPPLSTNPLSLGNAAPVPNSGTAQGMTDPSSAFGNALTGLLTKYQQLGRSGQATLNTAALNTSDASIGAANAQYTNPNLQGYAPGTIMNAGNSAARPFEAAGAGIQQVGKTFNEQLGNFGDALGSAKALMQEYQAQQDKIKANAQDIVHNAIATGSDSLAALIKSQPDLVKLAGYTPDTLQGVITGLKKAEALKEDATKQVSTVDLGNRIAVMDNKGNIIRYEAKGLTPSSSNSNANLELIQASLLASRGNDGFVDPGVYQQQKSLSKLKPAEFDQRFLGLLSPQERKSIGTGTKPPTDAQSTAALYATRMEQANNVINAQTDVLAKYNPLKFGAEINLPSYLQTSTVQQQSQAERNFLNAVLRRESGAVINPEEFSSGEKQYFPRPGDSPQTIQQKSQNRQTAIQGIANAAGSAYQAPSGSGGTVGKTSAGLGYKIIP